MYDSKFIKKTHYKRGKKIFPPPSLKSLKEKESKFVRETSALTQPPSDGKSTSTKSVESQGDLQSYVVFWLARVLRGKAQFLNTKLHYDEHN